MVVVNIPNFDGGNHIIIPKNTVPLRVRKRRLTRVDGQDIRHGMFQYKEIVQFVRGIYILLVKENRQTNTALKSVCS